MRPSLFLVFFALFLSIPAFAPPPTGLYPAPRVGLTYPAPHLKPIVGLRPFREGGIRLAREVVDGTVFVHNYGHGGAGLTLSWGTVFEAYDLVKDDLETPQQVVVVGGGVLGLSTAWELLRRGHDVTIYSAEFFPDNVSNIAGGLWSPVSVDLKGDGARMKRIQLHSFEAFRTLAGRGWPVRSMPLFVTEEAREKSGLDLFIALPELFTVTRHTRLPIEGVQQGGYEVQTYLIDTPVYMKALMDDVKLRGGKFVKKKFDSLRDVATVAGKRLVFHCSGLGARELARDENLIPVRGDLVLVQAHDDFKPADIGYMAFYGKDGTDYVFPRSGEIVVGGTFRKGNASTLVEPEMCERLMSSARSFYGLVSDRP